MDTSCGIRYTESWSLTGHHSFRCVCCRRCNESTSSTIPHHLERNVVSVDTHCVAGSQRILPTNDHDDEHTTGGFHQ